MQKRSILPPKKAERVAGQGNPIAISKALIKPQEIATTPATTPEDIQRRHVARLFFLSPEMAATVARLAYAGCSR
jgi:hypothetical protein